jgi:hypothetical protein
VRFDNHNIAVEPVVPFSASIEWKEFSFLEAEKDHIQAQIGQVKESLF